MAGPVDSALVVRQASDGALTADETVQITFMKAGVPVNRNLMLHVVVPQGSTSDTLKVTARSTDPGNAIEVSHVDVIDDNTTYPFELKLPMPPVDSDGWDFVFDVTGTSIDFGVVLAHVELAELAKVDA